MSKASPSVTCGPVKYPFLRTQSVADEHAQTQNIFRSYYCCTRGETHTNITTVGYIQYRPPHSILNLVSLENIGAIHINSRVVNNKSQKLPQVRPALKKTLSKLRTVVHSETYPPRPVHVLASLSHQEASSVCGLYPRARPFKWQKQAGPSHHRGEGTKERDDCRRRAVTHHLEQRRQTKRAHAYAHVVQ